MLRNHSFALSLARSLRQKRAKMEVARARRRGIPVGEYFYGPREGSPQVVPEPDANSVNTSSRSERRLRKAPSILNAAATAPSQRRPTKAPSLNAATSKPRAHLQRGWAGGDEERKQEGGSVDGGGGSASETDCSDEEEGGRRRRHVLTRVESRLSPVAECREHSTSAWLHFPHVELVVLFFAFEGAVATQISVLREGGCPSVTIAAAAALVSTV